MRGEFEKIRQDLWLHCEGRTFTVSLRPQEVSTGRLRDVGKNQDGALKSPMPGKILKVNFKQGDLVQSGQSVVVISAMKMEYALKAPFKGKIKSLSKKEQEQVALDEVVALIEKEDS